MTIQPGKKEPGEGGYAEVFGPVQNRGPGPFITHQLRRLERGGHLVANSRRHRKGLRPHRSPDVESAEYPKAICGSAFRHLWAPRRLAWWVALLFFVGSGLFSLGGIASTWPASVSPWLRDESVLSRIFVVGAIFFTLASWLQWLEAVNGDVAQALGNEEQAAWRWFGWCPRNLGYLASAIQLLGAIMFNLNTIDATFTGLGAKQQELWVWTPNMVGCVCFLVASYLAFAEVSQGRASLALRSLSWWIAVVNLLGSVAFQVSALYSFAFPGPASVNALFWSSFYTALGGLCFLLASYLMVPEVFDEEDE